VGDYRKRKAEKEDIHVVQRKTVVRIFHVRDCRDWETREARNWNQCELRFEVGKGSGDVQGGPAGWGRS